MRCSCQRCDTYMVHSESFQLGCVCPECGYRCRACLGTDSVVDRNALKSLSADPSFLQAVLEHLPGTESPDAPEAPEAASDPDQWLD